jgi:hypothetical protein
VIFFFNSLLLYIAGRRREEKEERERESCFKELANRIVDLSVWEELQSAGRTASCSGKSF